MKFLAALLCISLPLQSLARFEDCQSQGASFPDSGMTGYNSYRYTTAGNVCNGVTQTCRTEFPTNEQLRDRSWFLTANRDVDGLNYPQSFLQLFRVQCPVGTQLHLIPQRLETERDPADAECFEPVGNNHQDYVRIEHPDLADDIICGNQGNLSNSELYNGGLGRFLSNGNATVEFCTNPNVVTGGQVATRLSALNPDFDGFVVRATCVDPRHAFLEGCVDYQFIRAWDQGWLDTSNPPFVDKPQTLDIPHKRSVDSQKRSLKDKFRAFKAADKKMAKRFKRFITQERYEFEAGQEVTYSGGKFTFEFNNGSLPFCPDGLFFCLTATSDFFGARRFFGNAPFTFTGPGVLELEPKGLARLSYTINESDPTVVSGLLIPSADAMRKVNDIYNYIFDCWVFPYPVVDTFSAPGSLPRFPLPRSEFIDIELAEARQGLEGFGQVEPTRSLGFVQEDFWPIPGNDDSCFRGTLIRAAPKLGSTIAERLYDFCSLFYYSCNPLIRIACLELFNLK